MDRDHSVDCVKAVAIVGVLLIHASAMGGYGGAVGGGSWCAALFWGAVLRCAVPLFFLCSGALLLDPDKSVTVRAVWTKYLPRLFLALLFWAAAYEVFHLVLLWRETGVWEAVSLRAALENFLLFRHKQHLYYLHITLLVYAALPVLRVFTAAATRRQLEYALLLWLVLGVLWPTADAFAPLTLLTGIPAQFPLNLTWASLGYCVLGFYLKRYARERRPGFWAAVYGAGLLLTFGATLGLSLTKGALYEGFLAGTAPGVFLEAAGLFGLSRALFSQGRIAPRWASVLSQASFCVYLTHLFPLDYLMRHGVNAGALSPVWSVPLLAVIALAFGLAVWLVLRRVPWVNKMLI